MIPEIAYFSLILALSLSLIQAVFPMLGAYFNKKNWMKSAFPLTLGQCVLVGFAFFALAYAFLTHDFSVRYVAANSNILLPAVYRFCAVWGAHEGSILLWLFFLTLWMMGIVCFRKKMPLPFLARALSVLSLVSLGFLLFLIFTSDPFQRLFLYVTQEGKDLNPLLQDPGLVSHPPLLYAGYVGFAVPFAFALAGLLGERFEKNWACYSQPFTLLAWSLLTVGIVLGSWWAYRQLGWGGWWFWDPVENASFMPWLAGVILLHSSIVMKKRNTFHAWGILIAITAFTLSLLGTFIVRSGVLISVHSFAVDPTRGLFILIFLGVVVGAAFLVYALHSKKIAQGDHFNLFSKETFLLLNNVILFAALMTVLLGTLYPLFAQVLGWGKISVGPPYFNKTFGVLMLPLLFLMAVGPLVHWHKDHFSRLKLRLLILFLISVAVGLVLPYWLVGSFSFLAFLATALSVWIILGLSQTQYLGLRSWGVFLAHGGMVVCLLGIILSTVYGKTQDVQMASGDRFEMSGYQFQLLNVHPFKGVNYEGDEGSIAVYNKKGALLGILKPQIRFYPIQSMALPKAATDAGVFRDLYITLSEPVGENAWGLRFSFKPFVRWIWFGGLLMALGGIISAVTRSRSNSRSSLENK